MLLLDPEAFEPLLRAWMETPASPRLALNAALRNAFPTGAETVADEEVARLTARGLDRAVYRRLSVLLGGERETPPSLEERRDRKGD